MCLWLICERMKTSLTNWSNCFSSTVLDFLMATMLPSDNIPLYTVTRPPLPMTRLELKPSVALSNSSTEYSFVFSTLSLLEEICCCNSRPPFFLKNSCFIFFFSLSSTPRYNLKPVEIRIKGTTIIPTPASDTKVSSAEKGIRVLDVWRMVKFHT